MLGKITIFVSTIYIVCSFTHFLMLTLFLSVFINIILLFMWICNLNCFNFLKKACLGEVFSSILYSIWLYWFWLNDSKNISFLYFLSPMISSIGKLYMLLSHSQKIDLGLMQSLIFFQSKLQLGIFCYSLLSLFFKFWQINLTVQILIVLSLGAIVKLKHITHFGTQKAFKEIHFKIDRTARMCGLGFLYNILYSIFAMGELYSEEKIVTY